MQNQQNPDVNSTIPSQNYPDQPTEHEPNNIGDNEREPVPLPPDVENPYPVEDPPLNDDDLPLGDVGDSPKIIADAV